MEKHQIELEIRSLESNKIRARINNYQFSKMLTDKHGKKFIEKVPKEVWEHAINDNVKVYLNHDDYIELGERTTITAENDGVYLDLTLRDHEQGVYKAVKENRLHSCSFGFICKNAEIINHNDYYERIIKDMELLEISLLDKTPAYNGTTIENRELTYNFIDLYKSKLILLNII